MKPEFQEAPADDFLARIRARLPEMSRAERRLGTFLLDFPGELASYEAQELARLSGVSKATVSRFVRRIGFDSYDHARRVAREERRTGSRLFLGHAEDAPASSHPEVALKEGQDNVAATFARIPEAEIEACVGAILSARRLWLVGHRISQSFATYLGWQLVKIVADVAVVPRGGESLGEHIASMRAGDMVVHFALPRRMAGTDAALREIAGTGAQLALISDAGMPPEPALRWHFRCETGTESPQYNHAAVLALCHWIVVRAASRAGTEGRARLRRVDEINARLGHY
ncbi:MAG: SIS domain-containing protein [Deinococcus-Thermus bacterium]|jgi:DNA-binding MurR/RpiR family transcriptional regulator|nr:SIS domain-containing protein [Deinococcota bacterium]